MFSGRPQSRVVSLTAGPQGTLSTPILVAIRVFAMTLLHCTYLSTSTEQNLFPHLFQIFLKGMTLKELGMSPWTPSFPLLSLSPQK
jgi:hypothetical protein